jgi:membrane protease YdiL (CAAX protease family)
VTVEPPEAALLQRIAQALAYVFLLGGWLAVLGAWRRLEHQFPRSREFELGGWPLRFLFGLVLVFIGALFGLLVAVTAVTGVESPSGPVAITIQAMANGLTCLLALAMIREAYGLSGRAAGLQAERPGVILRFAAASYFAFLPVVFLAMYVTGWLYRRFDVELPAQDVLEIVREVKGTPAFAWLALLAVLVVPLTEEFLFRGILYTTLRPLVGRLPAILVSSLVFALPHDRSRWLAAFALGLLLAYVFDRTQSLLASSAVHVLHNGLIILFLMLAPVGG